jgi:hypothetical protein
MEWQSLATEETVISHIDLLSLIAHAGGNSRICPCSLCRWPLDTYRRATPMTRIAVTGAEDMHIHDIVRDFNLECRHGDARICVLVGEDCDRDRQLAAWARIAMVTDPVDAITMADAAIIAGRHAGRHLAEARPFLEAGMPVLIRQPLAASVAEAEEILTLAHRYGAPVTSFSELRFAPQLHALIAEFGWKDTPRMVVVSGATTVSDPNGPLFSGAHLAEVALHLTGPGRLTGTVNVGTSRDAVTVMSQIREIQIILNVIHLNYRTAPSMHVSLISETRVSSRDIVVGAHFAAPGAAIGAGPTPRVSPGLAMFTDMITTRKPLFDDETLLRPIRLLEAAALQLDKDVTRQQLRPTPGLERTQRPELTAHHVLS